MGAVSPARLLRILRRRLRAIWRADALDEELDRELAFHLEQLTAECIADGMTPEEARFAARRALGNMALVAEQSRDHRGVRWLFDLKRDVRFGLLMLRRSPAVSFVIAASLAIGIGANTVVLGAIDAVLRVPLSIPDADRVVRVRTYQERTPNARRPPTSADYLAWSEQNQSLESLAGSLRRDLEFSDLDGGNAERVVGLATTSEMFAVLRVPAAIGRVYTERDVPLAGPGAPVVISHALWQRRFGGSPDVVGTRFLLNRREAYVIGVMPQDFVFPEAAVDFWAATRLDRNDAQSSDRVYQVTARLQTGVTLAQAEADLNRIEADLARRSPDRYAGWHVVLVPVREAMYGWTREPLWTLEVAVSLVFLVVCTNVAGLLLARAVTRSAEMSVRAALGASRGRLVRQVLAETIVPAVAGGVLGVLLATLGVRALGMLIAPPGGMPMIPVTLNPRMVMLAVGMSVLSALLFGIAPAVTAARRDVSASRAGRWREGLVTAQIAVTLVLLIGAALLTRSFLAVVTTDVRFDAARLLTFDLTVPFEEFMQRSGTVDDHPYFRIAPSPAPLFQRLHSELRALPGVVGVAGASVPLVNTLLVPARQVQASDAGAAQTTGTAAASAVASQPTDMAWFIVTPDFMTTLGATLIRGRDLASTDTAASPWVVVVNQTAARRLWTDVDPIGRQLRMTDVPEERSRTVVGVIGDIPVSVPQEGDRPAIYVSYLQQPESYPLPGANRLGTMTFMIRTQGDPHALADAARRTVRRVDPRRTAANVRTMEEQLRSRVPDRAAFVVVIGVFAVAATLLAAIGIYGIVSYTAARRTREIGVRMALGATAAHVVGLVGRRAALLVGAGMAIGVGGAVAATRLLERQLFGVTPTDPLTYVAAAVLLLVVCAAACALPTRRATLVDPTTALRCE